MNKCFERVSNGIFKENPTFVLLLGMCPTLAVTTSAMNGLGMGLSTTLVLVFSNLIISLLRKIIPDKVRVPAFIVVVASLVTIVQFLLQGYVPSLYDSLGIYIPLIVVNCIILGRAESYASKNGPILSIFDGIGMGIGFTVGLTAIGLVREVLGSGQIFGVQVLPLADSATGTIGFTPITIFVLAPGAFFVLAFLIAAQNAFKESKRKRGLKVKETAGCLAGDCAACGDGVCEAPAEKPATAKAEKKAAPAAKPEAKAVAAKAETKAEAPAAKAEAPAAKAETPAAKAEAPAAKAEAPAATTEAPAAKAEAPVEKTPVPAGAKEE